MKKFFFVTGLALFILACGNNAGSDKSAENNAAEEPKTIEEVDPNRGIGKFKNVEVSPELNKTMADAGHKIYDVKCSSCHKLSDERLVGPGWKDVTHRRTAEWIMNFSTNPDEMLDKDPEAQAMLEICLVRMPNQGLTDDDARNVYEFMRENDGVQ